MPLGYPAGYNTVHRVDVVPVTSKHKQDHFEEGTFSERLFTEEDRKRPFYQVRTENEFPVDDTPQCEEERGHFCGQRMPASPQDAKASWALGDGNMALYCRELYLDPRDGLLALFFGLPHYRNNNCRKYIVGTEIVMELNNHLAKAIRETRRWKWDDSRTLWTPLGKFEEILP